MPRLRTRFRHTLHAGIVHHIETPTPHLEPQEYRLTIARSGIDVVGGDTEGVRNGVQTLRQIIRQCAPALPRLVIADKPAYKVRGYYLDATRGRVPTLDWLKTWADRLCLYKYNQLQLYIEHTFMFDDLSETWRGTSPLKPADIIAFDEYCARLGIELVPSVSTSDTSTWRCARASCAISASFPRTPTVSTVSWSGSVTTRSTSPNRSPSRSRSS